MRIKKAAAVATIVALLGGGLALVGAAGSASAHTGNLNATAVCNQTTGKYDVTYTLTTASTTEAGTTKWKTVDSQTFQGIPSSNTGLTLGPVSSVGSQTITLGTVSVPGTNLHAPWAYAFTTWTPDGFTAGSDGGNIDLAGTCTIPVVIPKDAGASIVVAPATCAAPGSAAWAGEVNVNTPAALDETPGAHTPPVVTAKAGHQFSDGTTSLQLAAYTIAAAIGYQSNHSDQACYTPPGSIKCVPASTPPAAESGDLPPTVDAVTGNLDFNGPTNVGQAEDWYYRVTAGNAQGLTGKYITYTGTSTTFPAEAVVEVSAANFPGSGFGTLSTNISAADATGTINLDTNGTWYSSKIASGPGSLAWVSTGHSETYAQLVSLIGTNHLLSDLSLHLQSNSPATAHSAVAAVGSICSNHVYTASHTTTPPVTPPNGVNTGDPQNPMVPVGIAALIALLLGAVAFKTRKASATL